MLLLGVVATFIGCCLASQSQETHRFVHVSKNGEKVAQDIIHDKEENTVLVIIGDVSMYTGYIPSVNLHDFNSGYVAFKDIRRQICMVSETPYERAMPEIYRMHITNVTKVYTAKDERTPLSYDQVKWLAGTRIADFCEDYITYFRQLIPKNKMEKRDDTGNTATKQPCWLCLWCVVQPDSTSHSNLFG